MRLTVIVPALLCGLALLRFTRVEHGPQIHVMVTVAGMSHNRAAFTTFIALRELICRGCSLSQ